MNSIWRAMLVILLSASKVMASSVSFPRDYGTHPAYSSEWWSVSAHLIARGGRRFSVQVAIFRFSLGKHEDLYSAEYSILDESLKVATCGQRSARTSLPSREPLRRIVVDDWKLTTYVDSTQARPQAEASIGDASNGFSVHLLAQKPAVASLAYNGYAFTRLIASGFVRYSGKRFAVNGSAWLDHEYEHPERASHRVGWERFEFQLSSGYDVELFAFRMSDGGFHLPSLKFGDDELPAKQTVFGIREPMDALLVDPKGERHLLSASALDLIIRGDTLWNSPRADVSYPALWQLTLPGNADAIAIEPSARDQEIVLASGVALWYGSVKLMQADPPGRSLGLGFAQLSGYLVPTLGAFPPKRSCS